MDSPFARCNSVIDQVFVGTRQSLPPEGQPTGMYKRPVAGPVDLGREGLAGDVQADRRVHGGPEKALHHYPAEHYATLTAVFPAAADALVPGSLGENVTTLGLVEDAVCVGDVFRLGTARIQVSQPRSPCWKIDCKFAATGMARFIAEKGITGWYYRVLETGRIGPGDGLELLDRNVDPVTLSRLWRAQLERRPALDELQRLLGTPGLAPGWAKKLADRLDWLRRNPELDFG
ncbi:MAG: MOSC domain-containing protein [Rhodocyclaceae bacterium]